MSLAFDPLKFDANHLKRSISDVVDSDDEPKKTGRRKIKIEYIEDKSRRHITFSKRKAGIMKKAYELSTLTGTQVLLLVASETGHVYTFATPKLQPIITQPEGKNMIQQCLNTPDRPESAPPVPINRLNSYQSPLITPNRPMLPNQYEGYDYEPSQQHDDIYHSSNIENLYETNVQPVDSLYPMYPNMLGNDYLRSSSPALPMRVSSPALTRADLQRVNSPVIDQQN